LGIRSFSQWLNKNALSLIWAGAFTDIFAFTILNPFLPRFYLDLGAPLAQIGLLLAINDFTAKTTGQNISELYAQQMAKNLI